MKIEGVVPNPTPQVPPGANNTGQVDGVNRVLPTGHEGTGGAQQGDKVEISPEARAAARAQEMARLAVEDPDVRPEAVEVAKQFLEQGLYNDQGVLEQTAANLSSLFQAEA
jgi:hypothetical protein